MTDGNSVVSSVVAADANGDGDKLSEIASDGVADADTVGDVDAVSDDDALGVADALGDGWPLGTSAGAMATHNGGIPSGG